MLGLGPSPGLDSVHASAPNAVIPGPKAPRQLNVRVGGHTVRGQRPNRVGAASQRKG